MTKQQGRYFAKAYLAAVLANDPVALQNDAWCSQGLTMPEAKNVTEALQAIMDRLIKESGMPLDFNNGPAAALDLRVKAITAAYNTRYANKQKQRRK